MTENEKLKEYSRVGLKGFFGITEQWSLTDQEKMALLGDPEVETYLAWQRGNSGTLPQETLERISHVFGIYKALRTLFPTEDRADAWIKKPNKAFEGRKAIEVMLEGNMIEVHMYLDAQCN